MSGRSIGVAVVQAELGNSDGSNVPKMEGLIREAAAAGASVVVLPELFEGPYFPKTKDEAHREKLHAACSVALEAFRLLAVYLKPCTSKGSSVYFSLALVYFSGSVHVGAPQPSGLLKRISIGSGFRHGHICPDEHHRLIGWTFSHPFWICSVP